MSQLSRINDDDAVTAALGDAQAGAAAVALAAKPEIWPRALTRPLREEAGAFGPFRFVRSLGECVVAGERVERFFAIHDRDQSSHAVYRWPVRKDHAAQRRLLSAIERVAAAKGGHLLEIEAFALTPGGQACVVTPYVGNQDGMMTLASHLEVKGGRLAAYEAERAGLQLLQAFEDAHAAGLGHGPLGADSVLIDRRGKLWIELHGVAWSIAGRAGDAVAVEDELRQVARLTFRMLTGVEPRKNRAGQWLGAAVLAPRLDPAWDAWFAQHLTRPSSAIEMMATMPRVANPTAKIRAGAKLASLGLLGLAMLNF
jgi:hypothetical protein